MSKFSTVMIAMTLMFASHAMAGEAHEPEGLLQPGRQAAKVKEPSREPQSQVDAAAIPSTLGEVYQSMYGEHHQVGEAKPIPDSYSIPSFPLPKR